MVGGGDPVALRAKETRPRHKTAAHLATPQNILCCDATLLDFALSRRCHSGGLVHGPAGRLAKSCRSSRHARGMSTHQCIATVT